MVSSQMSSLTGTRPFKPLQRPLFVRVEPSDVSSEYEEFDFSDVFGPSPVQASVEVNLVSPGNSVPVLDSNEVVYDDPVVIHNRSHSLVGPTTCVSQSLQLSKLTLHETESSLELVECVSGEKLSEIEESPAADAAEKPSNDIYPQSCKSQAVGLEDFEVMKLVGQGAFGKVFQVRKKGTSEIYAMKVMRKDKIMEKNHAEYMKAERDILTKIDHPFIVQLRYSFQTKYRLYLVLDFVNGGHLFFQLYHHGLFREDLARIYTAEIVSAVSHLHANGIMHRDLKPENVLLDADGHPPFVTGNREKIQQKIIKDKIKLPAFLSSEAHSLLKGLLQKEASRRLGSGPDGSEEIKRHKWFKPINWRKLEAREIQPSFRPNVAGKHCIANFEERWTNTPLSDSPVASPVAGECNFVGFTYVRPAPYLQRTGSFLGRDAHPL
ncbi:serine/threonine-protein kinase AtPK2/AtPK19-like isoform X2 [Magnolia sinica]|uniref:serine/threonine-protein kinase AtPK2/AtPK19-like isoform X2 n=1 Tax=Magnolia sinica TaxID=86752 RepID=UPI002658CD6B|nr:serine/threonine-protein kinase AtPK2/AtPK19-like isoform X2 [Magnolia sinica]